MTVYWDDKYADLPLLQCKPGVDDSQIAFDNDLAYCRVLLEEIQMQGVRGSTCAPFPIVLTDELDHALIELKGITAHIKAMTRG